MISTKTISTVHSENNNNTFTTHLLAGQHTAIADEPEEIGGHNLGPTPGDYLCMALASCKAITLRMYVQRKNWNIKNIEVKVSLERQETEQGTEHIFFADVLVDEATLPEHKERLLYIAKACPISKLLGKQNKIETRVVNTGHNEQ